MNNLFRLLAILLLLPTQLLAKNIELDNSSHGSNDEQNNIHLGLDLQTKYIWRGMEMMTEESTPVIFPQINYQNKGFYVYAMGGYSLNGKYSEVDLGISYTYKCLTIGVNDYYYPTTTTANDQYFNFNKNLTGHWIEGVITITPEKIPAYLTISNFFYGADKKPDGKQAYSTYVEFGIHYDFINNNRLGLAIGAACNESCYNGYEKGFGICNVELKYTHTLEFENGWSLPLNVGYIVNPVKEKSFVNFSTSFAF